MKPLQSNQRYALVALIFSIIYLVMGLQAERGFYNDPIGPNLWIIGISICLLCLSVLLFLIPLNFQGNYPKLSEWLSRVPFILSIFIYSNLLPWLGFLVTTPLLMIFVGINFKARPVYAVISALMMTGCCYLIFNIILDISLPAGSLWKSYLY